MAIKPELTPQSFARNSGRGLPSLQGMQQTNVQQTASVNPTGAQSAADAYISVASDFGKLQNVATNIFGATLDDVQRRQAAESERVFAESNVEYQQKLNELRSTASPAELPELSKQLYTDVTSTRLNQDDLSKYQRSRLSERFNQNYTAVAQNIFNYQEELNTQNLYNDIDDNIRLTSLEVFNNPAMYEERVAGMYNTMIEMGATPAQANEKILKAKGELASSTIRGMLEIDNSPKKQRTLQQIQSGRFDDILSGDEKANAINLVQAEGRSAEMEFSTQQLLQKAAVETKIKTNPYSVSNAELSAMRDNGLLSDSEFVRYVSARDTEKSVYSERQSRMERVASSFTGETQLSALSTVDKKDVDEFYRTQVLPTTNKMQDKSTAMSVKASFVAKTGVMPETLRNEIVAQIRAGGIESKREAVDMVSRMKELNPRVDLNIPEHDAGHIDAISSVIQFSENPELELAELDRIYKGTNPAVIQARQQSFKDDFDYIKAEQRILKEFEIFLIPFDTPNFVPQSGEKIAIQEEMKSVAMKYYLQNPDVNKAMDYAAEKVKHNWATTKIGTGGKRLMRLAPDAVLPPVAGRAPDKWVKEQLKESFGEQLGDKYFLQTDSITMRQQSLSAGNISYQVMKIKDDGSVEPIFDETGDILRFQPDPQEAANKYLGKAKEKREKLSDFLESQEEARKTRWQ